MIIAECSTRSCGQNHPSPPIAIGIIAFIAIMAVWEFVVRPWLDARLERKAKAKAEEREWRAQRRFKRRPGPNAAWQLNEKERE